MSAAVVDASVAVKWLVKQDLTGRAYKAFEAFELHAPSLILAEVANALWKYHRIGAVSLEKMAAAFDGLQSRYFNMIPIDDAGATRAFEIATRLDHPVYDCFYLDLARERSLPLLTADARLVRKAEPAGFDMIDLVTSPRVPS